MSKLKDLYKRAIEKWGESLQICMAIEEMAELTKELVKFFRRKWSKENIAEEIADVEIMTGQLKVMFENEELVEKYKKEKIERLEEMLIK